MFPTRLQDFKILFLLSFTATLSGCVTAARGSNTYFVVNTAPPGAVITTDKLRPEYDKKSAHNTASDVSPDSKFYGCAPTPCRITMPRRSQFNVMITKDGYQPFFYVVQKKHYKESQKDEKLRTAVTLTPNGKLVASNDLSENAGLLPSNEEEAIPVVAGTAFNAYSAYGVGAVASSISSVPVAGAGAVAAPIALLFLEPVILTNTGVDLASGSLLDLTPNPMSVKLAIDQETNKSENERLKAAFIASRNKKAGLSPP